MASLAVEAILSFSSIQAELIATGLASAVKMSDFVSDFFFIKDLIKLDRSVDEQGDVGTNINERRQLLLESDTVHLRGLQFGSTYEFEYGTDNDDEGKGKYEPWLPIKTYIVLASVFTGVGILFDAFMTYVTVQEHRKKKALEKEQQKPVSEVFWEQGIASRTFWSKVSATFFESDASKHEEHWVWWRHLNVVIEEIPQLVLLIVFYVDWSRIYLQEKNNIDDGDTKEYWEKTKASIFVSAAITSFLLVKITIGYILYQRSKQELKSKSLVPSVFQRNNSNDSAEKGRRSSETDTSGFFADKKSSNEGKGSSLFSSLKEEQYKKPPTRTKRKPSPARPQKKPHLNKDGGEMSIIPLIRSATDSSSKSATTTKKEKSVNNNGNATKNTKLMPTLWVKEDEKVSSSIICCGLVP